MVVEHVSEETREDEGTVPVVLGGPEDDLAGYICHRLRHLEATAKHVYATSPQRDRFSPAEASVGEHIDEGSELQRSQRCFWFAHKWSQVAGQQAGLHVGPQRGVSVAGDAGANWRMNIDGYINGSHVGGQSSVNLPVGKWVRVRVWKIGSGGGNSEWGVWAQWDKIGRAHV